MNSKLNSQPRLNPLTNFFPLHPLHVANSSYFSAFSAFVAKDTCLEKYLIMESIKPSSTFPSLIPCIKKAPRIPEQFFAFTAFALSNPRKKVRKQRKDWRHFRWVIGPIHVVLCNYFRERSKMQFDNSNKSQSQLAHQNLKAHFRRARQKEYAVAAAQESACNLFHKYTAYFSLGFVYTYPTTSASSPEHFEIFTSAATFYYISANARMNLHRCSSAERNYRE